jgi:sugar/nucleoside kinase (ribokinase family)
VSVVAVAGNLSLDDTVNPDGAFPGAPGGDALYASIGVRAWGLTPRLLTLVGDDYPDADLGRIANLGIDVDHVRRTLGPTVHYRVTYRSDGERTFEWISTEDRLLLTSPEAADYAALAGTAWLHVAAMPIEAQELAVAAGRTAGLPVSLDPHEEYIVGSETRLRPLVAGSAFFPSELEARLLFPDLAGFEGAAFGLAAAERLDSWQPTIVAVKLGELGSVVRVEGRSIHVPAPPVRVVDPTGAGDAWCGGFVAGWIATGSPAVAAACGTVAAGETIGSFGAFPGAPVNPGERLKRLEVLLVTLEDDAAADAFDAVRRQVLDGAAA